MMPVERGHNKRRRYSLKSQLITFGGDNPDQCSITLNGTQTPWTTKVRYIGVYFFSNNGFNDISDTLSLIHI